MGAWIETNTLPLAVVNYIVAPYVGAWIETLKKKGVAKIATRRTLRGCVD